jgi:drug/metabolite transporter (DMT)-like permease
MYSFRTSLILLGMILTGAGRSVGVKVFYQLGLANPLVVAGLYLLGQSLSLVVYLIEKYFFRKENGYARLESDEEGEEKGSDDDDDDENDDGEGMTACSSSSSTVLFIEEDESGVEVDEETLVETPPGNNAEAPRRRKLKRQGSTQGLTKESEEAISWAHRIPWYFKPIIPGCFNLANATLRWACFIYIPASSAEMLIAGSELILSVFAARIIRKRLVSYNRWTGVGIVTVGLLTLLIGGAHFTTLVGDDCDPAISSSRHHTIGNLFILGQSIMSVLQDITEEIFLQKADFPATLLLGMEGVIGLVLGGLLYFVSMMIGGGALFDNIASSLPPVSHGIGLALWFTMTGIFNILSTEATSSMTRNVWKNFRTLLVWILGLLLHYFYSTELGEGWITPESYVILFGYSVMVLGIFVYYR